MPTRPAPSCAAGASTAGRTPGSTTPAGRRPSTPSTLPRASASWLRRKSWAESPERPMRAELIDADVAARVISRALRTGGDFAEIYAERRTGLAMSIDEQRIEGVQAGGEEGAGIRVISGGTTYFAHVDGLAPEDLERAAGEAAAALSGGATEPRELKRTDHPPQPI